MNNLSASVRQRLYNLAITREDDFQRILTQYALERLLYRLSQSSHEARFVLKGALVFLLWLDEPHRRTRDLDLLGTGDTVPERVAELFSDICTLEVEADGLRFDETTIAVKPIREDNIYGGIRVTPICFLDKARIPLQIDVGFGDAMIPEPYHVDFPTLLDLPAPRLRAYAQETVIAEKLSAIVSLDLDNSRMKDFFDLWVLGRQFPFKGELLAEAIAATFARREMYIPAVTPTGLSIAFAQSPAKETQWKAFLKQSVSPEQQTLTLAEVVSFLADFLLPALNALREERPFYGDWPPGGLWRFREATPTETA